MKRRVAQVLRVLAKDAAMPVVLGLLVAALALMNWGQLAAR